MANLRRPGRGSGMVCASHCLYVPKCIRPRAGTCRAVGFAVRAFDGGGSAGRRDDGVSRMSIGADDANLYRLRSATDAAWSGGGVYRRRETFFQRLGTGIGAVSRLVMPVLLLVSIVAAIFLYFDSPAPQVLTSFLSRLPWMTTGFLVLPLGFFTIELTNRRYGAGYAFMQVVGAYLAIAAVLAVPSNPVQGILQVAGMPSIRTVSSFGVSFFIASFLSIIVFDGARGPRWWTAPLFGSLTAAIVFPALYWPCAFAGLPGDWIGHMLGQFGYLAAAALASLPPYWILRGLVPPLSGFGGY
jgi:hypothetical protein